VKKLAAPLAAALASLALAAPASAKVTKSPNTATHVLPCADGTKNVARVWYNGWRDSKRPGYGAKTFAVTNPCKLWVIIDAPGDSVSDPYGEALSIAPKTSFQTHDGPPSPDSDEALSIGLGYGPAGCDYGYTLWQVGPKDHGRSRFSESCPSAPWA